MRAIIVIDLEIDDGQRPGTRFARLEWVAKSVAGFVVYLRRVQQLGGSVDKSGTAGVGTRLGGDDVGHLRVAFRG